MRSTILGIYESSEIYKVKNYPWDVCQGKDEKKRERGDDIETFR